MFHKYITDITNITESGRKKNKQAQTWISPKCEKREVWALFWHSVHLCCHKHVLEQNSHTSTKNADSSSHTG